MLKVARAVAVAAPLDAGTAHFDASNLEFTTLDVGNPSTNVIPEVVAGAVRSPGEAPAQLVGERLRRPQVVEADVEGPTNAVAFLTRPDAFVERVTEAIAAETGLRPVLSTTPVDRREPVEIGHRHALVDLVHGPPDEAELDHRAFVERVTEAIAAETGLRPVLSTTGGTSDARFIKDGK
jgi:acetylornithine deacetylase/succinyl-diaminopimelate desuccinylase-like protein